MLQHPMEAGHAKNTARLLHLSLPASRLEVGETFHPDTLTQWLHHPWGAPREALAATTAAPIVRTVLLYPPTPQDPQLPVTVPPPLPSHWLAQPDLLRLVVIDGTWRKSRKMLYLNPALQALPRWCLQDMPPSRYAIRKAHAPDQLSSFEAGAWALSQLQGWGDQHPAWLQLMRNFDAAMVRHQALQASGLQSREKTPDGEPQK